MSVLRFILLVGPAQLTHAKAGSGLVDDNGPASVSDELLDNLASHLLYDSEGLAEECAMPEDDELLDGFPTDEQLDNFLLDLEARYRGNPKLTGDDLATFVRQTLPHKREFVAMFRRMIEIHGIPEIYPGTDLNSFFRGDAPYIDSGDRRAPRSRRKPKSLDDDGFSDREITILKGAWIVMAFLVCVYIGLSHEGSGRGRVRKQSRSRQQEAVAPSLGALSAKFVSKFTWGCLAALRDIAVWLWQTWWEAIRNAWLWGAWGESAREAAMNDLLKPSKSSGRGREGPKPKPSARRGSVPSTAGDQEEKAKTTEIPKKPNKQEKKSESQAAAPAAEKPRPRDAKRPDAPASADAAADSAAKQKSPPNRYDVSRRREERSPEPSPEASPKASFAKPKHIAPTSSRTQTQSPVSSPPPPCPKALARPQ
jgi:hypothetical protein